jgi:hypothetical protein
MGGDAVGSITKRQSCFASYFDPIRFWIGLAWSGLGLAATRWMRSGYGGSYRLWGDIFRFLPSSRVVLSLGRLPKVDIFMQGAQQLPGHYVLTLQVCCRLRGTAYQSFIAATGFCWLEE